MPWLADRYETLDDSIPLDRAIKAAGYRSIRQFCRANSLSESLVGCWRKGKPSEKGKTLIDEMTAGGISLNLYRLMHSTGCLEWELFPDVFTDNYYDSLHRGAAVLSGGFSYTDTSMERRETRRVLEWTIDTLPSRLRTALAMAFGLMGWRPLRYREIGRLLNCTGERARHLVISALRRLISPSRLPFLATVSSKSTLSYDPIPAALAVHNRLVE